MMRSLYSGVTGLRNHQTRMDVIGNNISNVNTVGFKGSRVVFQDLFSQTTATASSGGANTGGTNPKQVGLGVATATIDILQTRTATQYTGSPLDMAIQGDGFFVVNGNGQDYFTRAGNFYVDNNNYLVSGDGFYLQVYRNANTDIADGANTDYGDTAQQGGKQAENFQIDSKYFTSISIDKDGVITGIATKSTDAGAADYDAAFVGANPVEGFTTNPTFETGDRVYLGRVAIATFNNQNALEKQGGNLYAPTNNSGEAMLDYPGNNGGGTLLSGTLEMSNVDLSNEFTDMIITQRGFQANSRIITVSDSMLEELVNLKR